MRMEEGNLKRSAINKVVVFQLLCVISLLASSRYLTPAFAQKLNHSEVEILRQMHRKYKLNLWNFSADPCSSQGYWNKTWDNGKATVIECDCNSTTSSNQFCHVYKIALKSLNINGELPEEFAKLQSLSHIDLNRNNFHGNIPQSWASLPLKFLSLTGNNLTGPLPEWIGNIKTLEKLLLENNLFSGSLPSSLGNLTSLNSLLLSCNQFTGNIPESLGNLTNLKDFRIDGNNFSGIIPKFFVRWTKLKRLAMQGTSLMGPFPPRFSSLNLSELRVTDINISGQFPHLQNMELKHLTLRNLQLSGLLPEYIGDMKDLEHLDLSFNSFTGEIPPNYKKLKDTKLQILLLTSNNLIGEIPNWFNRMHADFSYNRFSGPQIQSCQDREKNLVASYAPNKSNINYLSPCLLRNLPCRNKPMNYELFINCGGEAVTVDNKTYVANTQSSSPSYFYESSDNKWGFSNTGFFEGIKGGKYAFNYTTTIQSSLLETKNEQLYTSARLNPLSLRYYGFCLQRGTYNVSLHFAEIMFTDDNTVSSNGRRIFDVSIQGRKVLKDFDIAISAGGVRKGIVRSFNTSVENGTLEIHFQWLGKGTQQVPDRGVYGSLVSAISVTPNFKPDTSVGERKNLSDGQISGIVLGSCAILALLVMSLLFVWQRKKHEKSAEFKELESMAGYFNLSQIKSATQNFAPENKIGEGGFGPVYKGELHDGTLIAVKKLSSKSRQGNREFLNEIGMISALQHPNLVKLFGCSVEGNQLMVIYEYMKNNSLAAALFGKGGMKMNLDWPSRCKIIQDIARGLAYLHEESIIKIVHRDIKASNILLDKNLNAKISDFGLAKLNEEEDSHISTRVAGTVGYMAPEYAMRGYLTAKADVYSFGIVVLEILSGKSNTGFTPKEDCFCLLDWANVLREQKNTNELIDPIINQCQYIRETHQMLNLVFWCTNQSPSLRPAMSTIVCMLEGNTSFPAAPMNDKRTESYSEAHDGFENNSYDSHLVEAPMLWSTFNSMFIPRG